MAYQERITKPREIVTVVPGVVPGVVGEDNIAADAVTSPKIKDETIRSEDIGAGQVQESDIAPNAVTTEKIAADGVTESDIASDAVTASKLKDSAVTTPKLQDGAVTTPKIADASVTVAKLGPGVSVGALADNSVTTPKIVDEAVTEAKLASNSVGAGKIKVSAVGTSELATGSVTPEKLSFSVPTRPLTPPIATDEIANLSVTYDKIANYSVNDEKLSASAVTRDKIQDASINPPKIDAVNTPTDGQALTYEAASSRFKYATPGAGGSKITLINPQTVFDETAMTDRSAPLSVATVVPATAIGVLVELHQDGMVPSWAQPSTQIQHPSGGMALTAYITGNSAGNMPMYHDNAGIVPVYSPQNIYLVINRIGVSTRVKVTVVGYIE